MNYQKTLDWLFKQLPMYQRQGKAAYKADLKTSYALDEALNNPHKSFPTIHIAGTNGKGSTAHFIASILQENGYKVGLHCSPHYFDFRERIKINGQLVSEAFVSSFVERFKDKNLDLEPSFFELTVLMAFEYFKEQKVDMAIIETGMGGRLDTTNIINPLVSVITNIGFDHTQFLGDTIEKIAIEKAGIIKNEVPVVLGEMDIAALEMIMTVAEDKDAEVHLAGISEVGGEQVSYQKENIACAISAVEILEEQGWRISQSSYEKGITNVAKNTSLIGRWQVVSMEPKVILDSAHNAHGISSILESIKNYSYHDLRIVIGMVDDKDVDEVLGMLPKDAIYYFCQAKIPRAKKVDELVASGREFDLRGGPYKGVKQAYDFALKDASNFDLVLVMGSIFVVGEVLESLK